MSLVPLVDRSATTDPDVLSTLEEISTAFGTVPTMFQAVANSPAALRSMWGSFGAFASGRLGPALSEQIAVAVANRNSCDYCLAAHTALGRKAGVSSEELCAAQSGGSVDPATEALLQFALRLVDDRGHVAAADVEDLRAHGWTDEQIVETIGQVALNLFTNYLNVALDVPVDFPRIALRTSA